MRTGYYQTYMTSEKWKIRREGYYATHAKECLACGSEKSIHLHHHTYNRLGNELDEDMVPLCETHHDMVHVRYQKFRRDHRGLTIATEQIIAEVSGKSIHLVIKRDVVPKKVREKARKVRRRARKKGINL